jgi:hypothetical protein
LNALELDERVQREAKPALAEEFGLFLGCTEAGSTQEMLNPRIVGHDAERPAGWLGWDYFMKGMLREASRQ